MKLGKVLVLSFVAMSMFGLCAAAAELKIGGGAAPMENIFKKVKAPFETSSGVKLALTSNGPEDAFKALIDGKLDIAAGGVSYEDWLEMMKKAGAPVADPSAFKARVIGKDIIKVYANKAVPVSELSKPQLKGIFSGQIKNWKEVGGSDQPITLVLGTKIPGTNKVFSKQVLEGGEFAKGKEAGDAPAILRLIASTPGAIGIGPMGGSQDGVKNITIPEVGRPITALTKGAPSPDAVKLFDFIRSEGQKHIAQ